MHNEATANYYYEKRYKSIKNKYVSFCNYLKGSLLAFISNNKFFSKKLSIWESFSYKRKRWISGYDSYTDLDLTKSLIDDNKIYEEIDLASVTFIEVISIDNFSDFRKKIIEKFGHSHNFGTSKDELKNTLIDVENSFDQISWGGLFNKNYDNSRREDNDLIDTIHCSYTKTNESYFILTFDIKLSKKAHSIFKKIIQQKDNSIHQPNYNSFFKIFFKRRFYSSELFFISLKNFGIRNLISDLNHQFKLNVTKHFSGFFHNSPIYEIMPSIEFYEVNKIDEFRKDKKLLKNFKTYFGEFYSLDDNQIEIYLSPPSGKKHQTIQVVKQNGHGDKHTRPNDLTNYDRLESEDLLSGLSFPCAFFAILEEQQYKVNTLKRKIYDQISKSKFNRFISNYFLMGINNKYPKLKREMIKILMTSKRFENEFTDRTLKTYTSDAELETFIARKSPFPRDPNLLTRILSDIKFKMETLDQKTNSINEIFRPLEEYNIYRTNLFLQRFSVIISILAFVFTFSKIKDLVYLIVSHFIR